MTKELFEFDEARAMDYMSAASMVDLETGQVSLYAVICINDDGESSHGGQVCPGPSDAVEFAHEANEQSAGNEAHSCKYVPVAIGIPLKQLKELAEKVLP